MNATITINDDESGGSITIENIPFEHLITLADEENRTTLFEYKFYMNTTYDKIEILGINLMILKMSKNKVSMICL